MKSAILTQFPFPWLLSFALCLFLGVFLAMVFWVFRPAVKTDLDRAAKFPLEKEDMING